MNLLKQRLLNQRIIGPKFEHPEQVVAWMGAMQAQDYGQAVWAIGLRLRKPSLTTVEQAIANGKIILTWPMRGTIHAVPAADARWMLQLTAARVIAGDSARQRQLGLTSEIFASTRSIFKTALQGGKFLTRPDLLQLLEDVGITTRGGNGYHLLSILAQEGLICLGPLEGKQQTFTLLEDRVPNLIKLSPDQALTELARRFYLSHGPATIPDFARWSGLTLTSARKAIANLPDVLVAQTIKRQEYWGSKPPDNEPEADSLAKIQLLPGFDEYVLGYKDRTAFLGPAHANKIVPGNNGVFKPTIVVNGRVVGVWKRTIKSKGVEVGFEFFEPHIYSRNQLEQAAEHYANFLDQPLLNITVN